MFGIKHFTLFIVVSTGLRRRSLEVIIKIFKSIYVYMPNKNINITSGLRYDIKIINALDK